VRRLSLTLGFLSETLDIMPLMLEGFGTRYYGKKAEDENGVYVTTLFVAAFYFPVLPLASYLVYPGTAIKAGFIEEQDFIAAEIPIDWRQVFFVYAKYYFLALIVIGALFGLGSIYIHFRFPERSPLKRLSPQAYSSVRVLPNPSLQETGSKLSVPEFIH